MFQPVTHVIFDMDGLLLGKKYIINKTLKNSTIMQYFVICLCWLDTESTYEEVIDHIAKKYGKTYTNEIKLKIRGTPEPITAKIAVTEMQLPLSPEEFTEIYRPLCHARLLHPPLMPGKFHIILHILSCI